MKFSSTPEKQQACDHPTLTFGSGDYYVMCRECSRCWVKTGLGTDEADPEYVNDTITGELRQELTIDNIKIVIEN